MSNVRYNKLPDRLFKVRVPIMATYTEEELELFGMPLEKNNGKVNNKSFLEMTVVMITLSRMIDIYMQGYPISIINQQESAEIYKILEDYLSGVNNTQTYSPNQITIKDDRLEEIDKFANEIFGFNRHTIVKSSMNVNHGYDLGFGLLNFNTPVRQIYTETKKVGILAGYEETIEDSKDINYSYINNTLPNVDVDKIKRRNLYRSGHNLDDFDK